MFPLGLVERPGELVAASQMRRGLRLWFKSTSHARRNNDHEGNSPENGIGRKFDVESAGRVTSEQTTTLHPADAQSICEQSPPSTGGWINAAQAANGVTNAASAIFSIRWRSIARAALYFGSLPSEIADCGLGKFSSGHHSHSFRPEMAGAHCLRYQPPDRRSRADRKHRGQCRGPRNSRLCHRAGGICATATVQPAIRC
jgi:hypothetical protein